MGPAYRNMEQNLIKQFKKYSPPKTVERDSEWYWLSIAQHHGLPTHLLDWTYSPLIAAHFTTSNLEDFQFNSAIWKVNFAEVHALLQKGFSDNLLKGGSNIFSIDDLTDSIKDLKQLDARHATSYDVGILFEPPSLEERIVNQFAYFSMLSDPFIDMDDWFKKLMLERWLLRQK
jgi:hypothetical protein